MPVQQLSFHGINRAVSDYAAAGACEELINLRPTGDGSLYPVRPFVMKKDDLEYDLVFEQWKDNLKFLTELVLVLNIKIFIWYGVDDSIGKMYDQLWKETDGYALETLKGDDLHYYLSTLD